MTTSAGIELGPHPSDVIKDALAACPSRTMYPADEVSDLLLDIQQSLARWTEQPEQR